MGAVGGAEGGAGAVGGGQRGGLLVVRLELLAERQHGRRVVLARHL